MGIPWGRVAVTQGPAQLAWDSREAECGRGGALRFHAAGFSPSCQRTRPHAGTGSK